jgi:hypothetical protein
LRIARERQRPPTWQTGKRLRYSADNEVSYDYRSFRGTSLAIRPERHLAVAAMANMDGVDATGVVHGIMGLYK